VKLSEALQLIEEAKVWWTYKDVKDVIFWDDLRDAELIEVVSQGVYHNFSLAKDTLCRLEISLNDLRKETQEMINQWPGSYGGDDEEFAIWDLIEGYVMELLARDSRIRKRAGWEAKATETSQPTTPTIKFSYVKGWLD